MRVVAIILAASAACAEAGASHTHSKPAHVLKMKQRSRPIKDEQSQRVANLHKHMSDLKLAKGIENSVQSTMSTPEHESEAYYAYPLTLDYVVDVAFQNGTEMVPYPVIVDTGSSNLAVAVESCTNCGSGSTTLDLGWHDPEMCIDVTYGSGSWDGEMSREIKVGFVDGDDALVDEVYVAGITYSDGFFCGGFYGILGLAYSGLSESYSTCTSSSSGGASGGSSSGQTQGHQSSGGQSHGQSGRSPEPHSAGRSPQPQAQPRSSGRQQAGAGRSHQSREDARPAQRPRLSQVSGSSLEQAGAETDSIAATPLLDSFYEDGLTENQQFSILFCGDDAAMSIGGVDESQIKGDAGISYVDTQMTYGEMYGYFLVEVESISVANTTVSTDSQTLNEIGGVLVDSGTTLIYLPSSVTQAIETEIEKSVPDLKTTFFEWSTCVEESELDSFPDLTIALDDYNLKLKPKQYLLWYGGCYYWGISTSSIGIIGNVALQDKLVVFDKDSNTIGFANGDCSAYGGDSYSDDDDTTSKLASMDAGATVDLATRPESVFIGAVVLVAGVVGMFSFRSRFSYAAVPEAESPEI